MPAHVSSSYPLPLLDGLEPIPESVLKWTLDVIFAGTILEIAVSAIQVFMWTYLVSVVLGAKASVRNRRLPYVLLSLIILSFSTASAILAAWCLYQLLFHAVPGPENVRHSLAVLLNLDKTLWLRSHLMRDICVWIADGMLVYRCWVVWSGNFWVAWGPVVLYVGALAVGIRTWIPMAYRTVNETDIATLVFTILVNVVVTALLSLRLQKAQSNVASTLVSGNAMYMGVIAILVESAAPMAVTGIGLVIASLIPTIDGWKAATIFDIFFKNFAVLAPQLIIFRVSTGQSWTSRTDTCVGFTSEIRFSRPPATSLVQSIQDAENSPTRDFTAGVEDGCTRKKASMGIIRREGEIYPSFNGKEARSRERGSSWPTSV
ncbi:hypothetical protein BKA70DRAFT_67326 [Coprinopsis sp. MPI-PUGE-AT-0042]|nr:hypothetical protein BKA70DRAFT_67326 [Coprinopsis sp. MPI-PUGE-AT-0042]